MFQENKTRQIFWKTNIFYPLIRTRTCAYQWVKNVRFSENLASFVFLKHPFWDSPFCLITDEFMILGNYFGSYNLFTLMKKAVIVMDKAFQEFREVKKWQEWFFFFLGGAGRDIFSWSFRMKSIFRDRLRNIALIGWLISLLRKGHGINLSGYALQDCN